MIRIMVCTYILNIYANAPTVAIVINILNLGARMCTHMPSFASEYFSIHLRKIYRISAGHIFLAPEHEARDYRFLNYLSCVQNIVFTAGLPASFYCCRPSRNVKVFVELD